MREIFQIDVEVLDFKNLIIKRAETHAVIMEYLRSPLILIIIINVHVSFVELLYNATQILTIFIN